VPTALTEQAVIDKDPLDRWVYGAENIGAEADLYVRDKNGEIVLDENGNRKVDVRKAHYALEKGYISAEKFGRLWRSTPRRIRQAKAA
jgi:hypothetical protein